MDETVQKLMEWVQYEKAGLIAKIAFHCTHVKCCQTKEQGKLIM